MRFRQILENLLNNAFRYTPSEGTVSLHVWREDGRVLVKVSDTGIGIREEDQELIFEAFYRSSNVEDRRGLGLGLSIVQEALSLTGGTITVASRVGEGTVMRVELPGADPEPAGEAALAT
ncbi:sensor histidine kinase KdpD [Geobacter sp. FeAm09]|uniref:sensor histidine kinase n=1 Tax=Geobacter sp. FeAm09 TaxID=2597769 RepID=UPI002103D1F7|nr:sensor histidine kinase [Geobacter sp. FeAm09]